jgi:type I restriction-modification system DNA methylase subunit
MYRYNTSISEALKQGAFDFDISNDYHYIKVGDTTVGQLKMAEILPDKNYGSLKTNKPDGLILHEKNTVIALVEYKKTGKINNLQEARKNIYDWYFKLADKLKCNVVCITDGENSYWFHAQSKNEITKDNGETFYHVLDICKLTDNCMSQEEKEELAYICEKFTNINKNGTLEKEVILNPQELAKNVWQKIWISTGKEPEKCLYNVVEIFIFKFLSDLSILEDDYSFDSLFSYAGKDKDKALTRYATQIRPEIKKMFPKGNDQTTIINGTIFVNEKGEPNLSQSTLFYTVLKQFSEYGEKFGSFKNIDRNFKTRLYESFLRQSAGVSALGQYFTPRNVVKAIVKMANGNNLPEDAVIGDPFCGVGGFILEFINEYNKFKKQYEPINSSINPRCTILGYDKGTDEKDDQRTIILAKANMLIYLSDLLVKHKGCTKLFSEKVFNNVFHLVKTNLGTFGITEPNKYNLIITNPPYVTSGVSTIKNEIKEEGLSSLYSNCGNGLEGLAVSWVINSLKENGSALMVLPDGIMNRTSDRKLRDKIVHFCTINAIIALPSRTFFATPKQTYILSLTKKEKNSGLQTTPVFTYIISEIGETRDSKRFESKQNDLQDMAIHYRQFMASPNDYIASSERCKIQSIRRFTSGESWMIEKDWSDEERIKLGIENDITEISEEDFIDKIGEIKDLLSEVYKEMKHE